MTKNGNCVNSFRRKDPVWQVAAETIVMRLASVTHYLPLAAHQASDDLEYVHQLRVSTRRTVAALDLYDAFLPKKQAKRLRRKLKQIRRAAGNARDCDVLLIRHEQSCDEPSAKRFVDSVRRKRGRAQIPITGVYQSLQGQANLDCLANKLITALEAEHADQTRPRFGPWARKNLRAVVDDFFAAQPDDLRDLEGLHEFRIAGKRLRYTIELLESAFPKMLGEELYPAIESIQESLGDINDHAVALTRFRKWRRKSDSPQEKKHLKSMIKREQVRLKRAIDDFAEWWTPKRRKKLRKRFHRLTDTT